MQLRPVVAPGCGAGTPAHASPGLARDGHWEGSATQTGTRLPEPRPRPLHPFLLPQPAPARLPGPRGLARCVCGGGHLPGSSLGFHGICADVLCSPESLQGGTTCFVYLCISAPTSWVPAPAGKSHAPSLRVRGIKEHQSSSPYRPPEPGAAWAISVSGQVDRTGSSSQATPVQARAEVSTWRRSPWLGWLRTRCGISD